MQVNFIQSNIHDIRDDLSCFVTQEGLLNPQGKEAFRKLIYTYYAHNKRMFAWRDCDNYYYIVVSEIMLQQTQTDRVQHKFKEFITVFPTLDYLARASVRDVIACWQGLGYNRRALALHMFAQRVISEYNGVIPDEPRVLQEFKGIGPATASSICAFAFNKPTVFIETNIRAVFIHCFFKEQAAVKDAVLYPLVEQTLDTDNPRQWYYALMDYGVMLKKVYKNPGKKSAHYAVQSTFEGSDRQIRGAILKALVQYSYLTQQELIQITQKDPERVGRLVQELVKEQFLNYANGSYSLHN